MFGNFEVEDKIPYDVFAGMIRNPQLTAQERECLKRHFDLPYDEDLVPVWNWQGYVVSAFQKMRGNSCNHFPKPKQD